MDPKYSDAPPKYNGVCSYLAEFKPGAPQGHSLGSLHPSVPAAPPQTLQRSCHEVRQIFFKGPLGSHLRGPKRALLKGT